MLKGDNMEIIIHNNVRSICLIYDIHEMYKGMLTDGIACLIMCFNLYSIL